ncbi:MAG: collagen-like protein [Hamadaea sp.]|nr:collagen-like protein [Hamadaea sp.]NUO90624.1 collagen-like protein [Dermatophilaceae bacterium]
MNDETTPTAPHPPSEEVAIAAKRTTRTMWQALLFGGLAILIALVAVLVLRSVNLTTIGERDAAQDQAQSLANGVVTGCASANVRAALTKAGQAALCGKAAQVKSDPQPGPKGDPGDPGAKGDTGSTGAKGDTGAAGPAPTQAQVVAAVQAYCAANGGCRGAAGASITQAQAIAAVATYCSSGTCKGPTGATGAQGVAGQEGAAGAAGADGKNGADSTVPGPQGPAGAEGPAGPAGPGPTQAQINEAVTAYCSAAADRCTGPAGPKGDTGAAGTDGTDAVPFTFTFTIPADGPLKDAQTYSCTVTAPNDPVTCTRAA